MMPTKSPNNRYTDEQLDFIRAAYAVMTLEEVTDYFNAWFHTAKTVEQIRSTTKNHKIACGRKQKDRFFRHHCRLLTPKQDLYLREAYQSHGLEDCAKLINREFGLSLKTSQVRSYLRNHGITSGRTGRFEAGQQSWNKGRKGYMGANVTSFKKGSVPPNRRALWSERIDSKDGFILIKVPERDPHTGFSTRFKHKHVWIWEQAHGPTPEGHVIAFKDGNKLNCTLDNLMLLNRGELLQLNRREYRHWPEDLKPSLLALARLEAKTFARKREARRSA